MSIPIFPNPNYRWDFCLVGEIGNEGRGREKEHDTVTVIEKGNGKSVGLWGLTCTTQGHGPAVGKIHEWYKGF